MDIILLFIQSFLCFLAHVIWFNMALMQSFHVFVRQSPSCSLITGSDARISVSKLTYSRAEILELNCRTSVSNSKSSYSTSIKLSFLTTPHLSKQFFIVTIDAFLLFVLTEWPLMFFKPLSALKGAVLSEIYTP